MRIGLSYDLRGSVSVGPGAAKDALEEYDSAETVEAIASALEVAGHSVVMLGGGRDFISKILDVEIDIVFNIAEGRGNYRSREAQVPSILEMLDVPYTGSDPLCLSICLDKPLTKALVQYNGISTPKWRILTKMQDFDNVSWEGFRFPAFVKPAHEGSSMGIGAGSRVEDMDELTPVASSLLQRYRQPVMVEEFIDGDEVTVGIVGNSPPRVVGIMRVLPRVADPHFIYSVQVKRDWKNLVDYECPARLSSGTLQKLESTSIKVFQMLGCRDFARVDYRVNPTGEPFFIEINPLPGLGHHGDLPIMSAMMGISHQSLISSVLKSAIERYPQCVRK